MTPAIGIDMGGTRIKALAYDLDSDQTITTHSLLTRDGDKIDGSPSWRLAIKELVKPWVRQESCRDNLRVFYLKFLKREYQFWNLYLS